MLESVLMVIFGFCINLEKNQTLLGELSPASGDRVFVIDAYAEVPHTRSKLGELDPENSRLRSKYDGTASAVGV